MLNARLAGAALAVVLTVSGCGAATSAPDARPAPESAVGAGVAAAAPARHVVVVSVDGLRSDALRKIGLDRLPAYRAMIRRGAGTRNARTESEITLTMPNHTGMLTSRRVDEDHGGHGVWINEDPGPPTTVQSLAGHAVPSVFDGLDPLGKDGAVFTSKDKFALFDRSWPSIDTFHVDTDNARLMAAAVASVKKRRTPFHFIHLSAPDVAGHESGWMSRPYRRAVRLTDSLLGDLLRAVRNDSVLASDTVVVVTADHGGTRSGHGNRTRLANYRVPFLVWGAGVPRGVNLYDLNPERKNPGRDQIRAAARTQPIRNADVANLVLALLGGKPLAGSQFGVDDPLVVTR